MSAATPSSTQVAERPTSGKNARNSSTVSSSYGGKNSPIWKPGWKSSELKWEHINHATWQLSAVGRYSNTPASHGQWSAYRTSYPVAWVMNIGAADWLGRCRDKRGDWCLGPTTFDDARTQTKNWVLGLPVNSEADEWFMTNPTRELNEIQAALMRRRSDHER
jgi:hypothetical protein